MYELLFLLPKMNLLFYVGFFGICFSSAFIAIAYVSISFVLSKFCVHIFANSIDVSIYLIASLSVMLYPPHTYPREFPYPLRGNKLFYNVCKKLKVPLCLYFSHICNRYMGLILYYSFLSYFPSIPTVLL